MAAVRDESEELLANRTVCIMNNILTTFGESIIPRKNTGMLLASLSNEDRSS